jgi:hypothetical protein
MIGELKPYSTHKWGALIGGSIGRMGTQAVPILPMLI